MGQYSRQGKEEGRGSVTGRVKRLEVSVGRGREGSRGEGGGAVTERRDGRGVKGVGNGGEGRIGEEEEWWN